MSKRNTKSKSKQSTGALNTLHQSLTVEDWQMALEAVKARHKNGKPKKDRRDPKQTRHQTIRRCLLRVDRGETAPGIYMVRSRDISDGGMRLVHGGPVKPDSICCVIIETDQGLSTAIGGVAAWCNPIADTTPPAFELGIRFYEPIDAGGFAGQDNPSVDAA